MSSVAPGPRTSGTGDQSASRARILVIMPTYNECASLSRVVSELFAHLPAANVLVVDDASPDGTGDLADQLARRDPRVAAMRRPGKLGLGSAYVQGFHWGIARGYDVLVEMDADGSHPAQTLPELVRTLGDATSPGSPALVIGSRWVPGGSVLNWPRRREALSRGGNAYARMALGIPVSDATAGFRAYRADALATLDLATVDSYGYCFQIDMTLRMIDAGYEVCEVPIVFRERTDGESKMSRAIVLEAMWKVTLWGARRRLRRWRAPLLPGPAAPRSTMTAARGRVRWPGVDRGRVGP
jgi:dolichol-phosphate mannosyltransferase